MDETTHENTHSLDKIIVSKIKQLKSKGDGVSGLN